MFPKNFLPHCLIFFEAHKDRALMFCDEDGVPRLVQGLVFEYWKHYFWAKLITGQWVRFEPVNFCSSIGLLTYEPTDAQFWAAWVAIEKYVGEHFEEYSRPAAPPDLYESWRVLREALFS